MGRCRDDVSIWLGPLVVLYVLVALEILMGILALLWFIELLLFLLVPRHVWSRVPDDISRLPHVSNV